MVDTQLDLYGSLVTEVEDRRVEVETVKQTLRTCGYLEWSLTKVQDNIIRKEDLTKEEDRKRGREEEWNRGMVVSYVQSLAEKVSRVFKKKRVSTADRPHLTLRNILVHPKGTL